MTEPVRIGDLSWPEFENRAPQVPYWIIVTGSVEQHGPHLPLAADTLVMERLAELSAVQHGAVILGTIPVGVMHAFAGWPGSQRVPGDVLSAQVLALAAAATPFRNQVLILNGHDENHEPLLLAARELTERHAADIVLVEWAQLVTDVIRDISDSPSESHAGEALTSLFLHWYPDRVRVNAIAAGTAPEEGLVTDDLHVAKRAHHPVRFTRDRVPTGVIGDPRKADATKGAVIAEALRERVDLLVRQQGWVVTG